MPLTLTRNVAAPAVALFRSPSIALRKMFASGSPINVAFPPLPSDLFTAFSNACCRTNKAWGFSQGCRVT